MTKAAAWAGCWMFALGVSFPCGLLADQLRCPWDAIPPGSSHATYRCPAIHHVAANLNLEGFYSDPSYSVIDPEKKARYDAASRPVSDLADRVAVAADVYRADGNAMAARCALAQLLSAARDGALAGKMQTKQAYYVQGWIAGALALDFLKVRAGVSPSPAELSLLQNWFRTIANQTMAYYARQEREGGTDGANNHIYWAGLELAAIAVVDSDRSYWEWSMTAWQKGVSEIAPDGTLPRELARKSRALHYHLFAASPLVTIAELACANHIDLYSSRDRALGRLVNRALSGLIDNSYFAMKAGVAQDTPNGLPTAEEVGWAKPFLDRYPDPTLQALVSKAPSLAYEFLGGLPPDATTRCESRSAGDQLSGRQDLP